MGHFDRLAALAVATLADKADQQPVVLTVADEMGLELFNPLVRFAENYLVRCSSYLARIHEAEILSQGAGFLRVGAGQSQAHESCRARRKKRINLPRSE